MNTAAHGVGALSAEFLCHHAAKLADNWQPGRGFMMDEVLGAIRSPGQPLEMYYPYQPDNHEGPLTEPQGEFDLYASAGACRTDVTVAVAMQHLKAKKPVGLVIQVCQALMSPLNGVVKFDSFVLPDVYHAVIGVGIGVHAGTGEVHVLVRNSWGTSWGVAGHAWLSLSLLEILLIEGFLI
ncbi:C1 family peptidase [Comamonas sp. BIGb0124]|uniref:C1 family peptidase n=1 Tax=Comamonas sp. BIGb0124 TaxID=2485130 RepID=UPI0013158307|nr:C1 family peptidase [Comamonas sp. BIGb0124]